MSIASRSSKIISAIVLMVPLFLVGTCTAPTVVDSSWLDPSFHDLPFGNLTVLALFNTQAESRDFETRTVEALRAQGLQAEEGHRFISDSIIGSELNYDEIEEKLLGVGSDGLLIFKLIGVDKDHMYVPPTSYIYTDPLAYGWPYFNYFHAYPFYFEYLNSAYQVTLSPGYWLNSEYYVIETTLYDNATDQLVWTIKSETMNPDDLQDLAESVIATVSDRMVDNNLIAANEN